MTHKENTAWFEKLYQESGADESAIPWAKLTVNEFLKQYLAILSSLKYGALYQN